MRNKILIGMVCGILAGGLVVWADCPPGCEMTTGFTPVVCNTNLTCDLETAVTNNSGLWVCADAIVANQLNTACKADTNSCTTCTGVQMDCWQAERCKAIQLLIGGGFTCQPDFGYGVWHTTVGKTNVSCVGG